MLTFLRMTNAEPNTPRHSYLGVASFVLSFVSAVVFAGAYLLVLDALSKQPSGADQTGYAFGMFLLLLLTITSEVVALELGVAGALQWPRKRAFAFVGVACSVLVLVEVGIGDLASFVVGFAVGPPEVRTVGNH